VNRLMLLVGFVLLAGVVAVGSTLERHGPAAGSARSLRSGAAAVGSSPTDGERTPSGGSGRVASAGIMTWRVVSSYTAHRIENQYLDTTARGIYIIVKIAATNGTSRPLAFSADQVSFESGGTDYAPDPGSVASLELGGHPELSASALGPAATTTGWVAFDVPPSAISARSQVCFGDRRFTPMPGCIAAGSVSRYRSLSR
jgi:hypothetical protein